MTIVETDTDRMLTYSGSAWVRIGQTSATGRTGCVIGRSSVQSVPDATQTTISWDTEATDTDAFISVPSGTVTVPSGLGGLYTVTVQVAFSGGMGALGGLIIIKRNSTTWEFPAGQYVQEWAASTGLLAYNAGDTMEVTVTQTSGGSLNMTAELEFWRAAA